MKNIGKPCAGKLHARFDEGGQARTCSLLYPGFSLALHFSLRLKALPLLGCSRTITPVRSTDI